MSITWQLWKLGTVSVGSGSLWMKQTCIHGVGRNCPLQSTARIGFPGLSIWKVRRNWRTFASVCWRPVRRLPPCNHWNATAESFQTCAKPRRFCRWLRLKLVDRNGSSGYIRIGCGAANVHWLLRTAWKVCCQRSSSAGSLKHGRRFLRTSSYKHYENAPFQTPLTTQMTTLFVMSVRTSAVLPKMAIAMTLRRTDAEITVGICVGITLCYIRVPSFHFGRDFKTTLSYYNRSFTVAWFSCDFHSWVLGRSASYRKVNSVWPNLEEEGTTDMINNRSRLPIITFKNRLRISFLQKNEILSSESCEWLNAWKYK